MSKRGLLVVLPVFTAIVLLMVVYNKHTQSAQLLHIDVKDIPSTFEVEPLTDTKSKEFQEKQEERFKAIRERISLRLESDLTGAEKASINACIPLIEQTTFNMKRFGLEVRRFQLDYLTDHSNVIEIGGNIGRDSSLILQSHNPMKYIILEPIEYLYKKLVEQFRNRGEVRVYNFGLAATDGVFYIAMSGAHEEGTSIFTDKGGQHAIRLMNTTHFFTKLGLGEFECDLLLINCEGCEFDILESLIFSNMIRHFHHVLFQTHIRLEHIENREYRYCRIQQLLRRTFKPSFIYKSIWESWERELQ